MKNKNTPINVIILEDIKKIQDDSVEDYISILITCKTANDFIGLVKMIIEDTRRSTMEEIITKDIQFKAEILNQERQRR